MASSVLAYGPLGSGSQLWRCAFGTENGGNTIQEVADRGLGDSIHQRAVDRGAQLPGRRDVPCVEPEPASGALPAFQPEMPVERWVQLWSPDSLPLHTDRHAVCEGLHGAEGNFDPAADAPAGLVERQACRETLAVHGDAGQPSLGTCAQHADRGLVVGVERPLEMKLESVRHELSVNPSAGTKPREGT